MSLKKRFFKHPHTQAALVWLLAMYIRLTYATSRKTLVAPPAITPYARGDENAVCAFWHGRMMMMLPFYPSKRIVRVLSSQHRDGMLTTRIIEHFGHATIRGSSSKGGKAAMMGILHALEAGDNIGITPDGPRGPVQIAQKGVMAIAKLSGKPVLPVAYSSTRCVRFNTWDRFLLPLPFGHLFFCIGEPIWVDHNADDAAQAGALTVIEQALNAQLEKADELAHA